MVVDFLKQNFFSKILMLSFALAPLLGSITLLGSVVLLIFSLLHSTHKARQTKFQRPFILIGLIFIGYFCVLAFLETFQAPNIAIHIRELGKIFPIFVLGVLSCSLKNKMCKVNYVSISSAAIFGVYITVISFLFLRLISSKLPNFFEPYLNEADLYGRLTMGSGNPLPFGTLLITISFITLVGVSKKTTLNQVVSFGAFVCGVLTVVFWNQSRGPTLTSLPLAVLTLWYILNDREAEYRRTTVRIFTLSIIIISIVIFNYKYYILSNIMSGLRSFIELKPYEESVGHRLIMYKTSWKAILNSPLIGYGITNRFTAIIPFLGNLEGGNFRYSHVHNTFLNHTLSAGVLGLLSISTIILTPLIDLYCRGIEISKEAYYFSLIVITSMLFHGLTNVLIMHDLMANFFGVLILIGAIAHYNSNKNILT